MKIRNIAGERRGHLEILELARTGGHAIWRCACHCGHARCRREVLVRSSLLIGGQKTHCGALRPTDRNRAAWLRRYATAAERRAMGQAAIQKRREKEK
jgi:hypothetical protein